MGTLLNQRPRDDWKVKTSDLGEFISAVLELSKEHKIVVTDVIAASQVLQFERMNDLYVANGEAFDEQIAGIGELLSKLTFGHRELE